jgi:hypothetical protein
VQPFRPLRVARLIEGRIADVKVTDWLSERTRDCPQNDQQGVTRACGAVTPDPIELR